MADQQPGGITPDEKDWTWTLDRACPDCGFVAAAVADDDVARLLTAFTSPWPTVLVRADVRDRPDPATWSPLEYGAHVRDVCRLFTQRTDLMLEQDNPSFANWDQDATAIEDDYASQDPEEVAGEILAAGVAWASRYAALTSGQWERAGVRSNGSPFTVRTLAQYGLHDLGHHLWDVGVPLPGR